MNQDSETRTVDLKNPLVAASLSFLLPGAGHFYQGRTFKGIIYCVCVMTLLLWGLSLGKWGVVFMIEPLQPNERDIARLQEGFPDIDQFMNPDLAPDEVNTKVHLGFLVQAPIGLVSIPAFIQDHRYFSAGNLTEIGENLELNQSTSGKFAYRSSDGDVVRGQLQGTLQLSSQQGEFGREMQGTFTGTDPQGNKNELTIRGLESIGPPIGSESTRPLMCYVTHLNGEPVEDGVLRAELERSWINHVFVPPNIEELERLHGELGKKFSLAEVFTWIAGLLNILVIWDAYAGPAYGYRMPRPEEQSADPEKKADPEAKDEKTESPPETKTPQPAAQST